jgi:Uncharacterized conserved protein
MIKRLGSFFIKGLLLIAPLVVTGYIVYKTFQFTDGLLSDYLDKYFEIKIPGLGILLIIIFLIILGIIGETIVARPVRRLVRRILLKAPFLNLIYSSINDLFSAFVGKEKNSTDRFLFFSIKKTICGKWGLLPRKHSTNLDFPIKLQSISLIPTTFQANFILFPPAESNPWISLRPKQ